MWMCFCYWHLYVWSQNQWKFINFDMLWDCKNFIKFQVRFVAVNIIACKTLRWRHNDHAGVSNHQPHGCLLNRLFRRRSTKTSKLRVTGLCVGNSTGLVNSPYKGPVTRKMFPFDDVIMNLSSSVEVTDERAIFVDEVCRPYEGVNFWWRENWYTGYRSSFVKYQF